MSFSLTALVIVDSFSNSSVGPSNVVTVFVFMSVVGSSVVLKVWIDSILKYCSPIVEILALSK